MKAYHRTTHPASVAVRNPTDDEAARVAAFLNSHGLAIEGEPVVDADEVATWFGFCDTDVWIAESRDGEIVAYADLTERGERTRDWLDLREHPDRREAGGGRALLLRAEEHARTRAATGALLRPVVSSRDAAVRSLYEDAGFRLVRHSLEMETDLRRGTPQPAWPAGIAVRTFLAGQDDEPVHAAAQEAFEDHWDFERLSFESWDALNRPGRDPSLWFVAEDGDEIAGLCLCRVHPSGDATIGHVNTLAVRAPWRRRGLGLALLHHAFARFRARGMTRATLGVDAENLTGAVRLYHRAGMQVASRSDTYEKLL